MNAKRNNVYDVNKLVHKIFITHFPHLMIYLKIYDMTNVYCLIKNLKLIRKSDLKLSVFSPLPCCAPFSPQIPKYITCTST